MNKTSYTTLAAIIFFVLIAGGFYYAWSSSMASSSSTDAETVTQVEVADISGMTSQAQRLVAGMDNNANLPIAVPTAKMGKTNPFTPPE